MAYKLILWKRIYRVMRVDTKVRHSYYDSTNDDNLHGGVDMGLAQGKELL
jgi:hypothetical protein